MPQVPIYNVPQVQPENAPDIRGYATPSAFGAQVGQAEEGLGQGIEKLGNVLETHAVRLQDRVNRTEADKATMDYIVEQSDLDSKQKSLEGKARADGYQGYIDTSRTLREKYSNNMSNQESKMLFDTDTRRYFAYSVRNEAYGVGSELKRFASQTNKRLTEVGNLTVQSNPENEEAFTSGRDLVLRGVKQEGENKGWGDEETAFRSKQAESGLWVSRIEALANKDPVAAVKMFDENKDKMQPQDREAAENKINKGKQTLGSKAFFAATEMKKLVDSDLQSVSETGEGVKGVDVFKVHALLGEGAATAWKEGRADAQKIYDMTNDVPTITQEQMNTRLRNITPQPGSAKYTREIEIFKDVEKSYNNMIKLRNSDPASAVNSDPTVADLQAHTDMKDPAQVSLLIDARLAAQTRAGISEASQGPIPVAEARDKLKPFMQALPGQEAKTLDNVIGDFKKSYGDNWKRAFDFAVAVNTKERAQLGSAVPGALRRSDRESSTQIINDLTPEQNPSPSPPKSQVPVPAAPPKPNEKKPLSKKILENLGPKKSTVKSGEE